MADPQFISEWKQNFRGAQWRQYEPGEQGEWWEMGKVSPPRQGPSRENGNSMLFIVGT